jgi:hypothetical protein
MVQDLVRPTDIDMSTEPTVFGHGKGQKLDICHKDGKVSFKLSGTLVFGLGDAFVGAENSQRRGLLVRYDNESDAVVNEGMSEWFSGVGDHILAHICANVKTIFPLTPREVIEENGFTLVDTRYGGEAIKLRIDLESTEVMILDPMADSSDDIVATKRLDKDQIPDVLTRDAHVTMTCELAFVWLDDTMTYGVSMSANTIVVAQGSAHAPRSLIDFEANLVNIVVGSEPKKFPGGQGRYVGLALDGSYPTFLTSDTVGQECDGLKVKFQPSAGKDAPPDSEKLSVPVGVTRGSTLHNVTSTLDTIFLKMASTWFPGKGPAALKAMFKSPCKEKEGFDPMLYVKLNRSSVPGRDATQVFLVPDDAPMMSLADAMTTDHGFPEGTVDDIARGSSVAMAATFSCVWLQSATFGWGISATHVFVHSGAATIPMEIDGRVIKRAGTASADDLDAFLGRAKRHCCAPPDACDMEEMTSGQCEDQPGVTQYCKDASGSSSLEPGEIPMAQRSY